MYNQMNHKELLGEIMGKNTLLDIFTEIDSGKLDDNKVKKIAGELHKFAENSQEVSRYNESLKRMGQPPKSEFLPANYSYSLKAN